jgi:predicted TIM-barrel fold metal-dependent hydrolase
MITADGSIYAQPKIDCHCHVLDPRGFAYADDVAYRPDGQETGSADYFQHVLNAYGVQHALLVGPNSGYGTDNRCLLNAIAQGQGRFKGIAVVTHDASHDALQALKAQGIVGIAFNYALHGLDYYSDCHALFSRLAALDMFVQVQIRGTQLCTLAPALIDCGARLLIDHCSRPDAAHRTGDAGFDAALALADCRRATVKLSGFAKFSGQPYPFLDTQGVVQELLQAYGAEQCVWASDWPFLRAPQRLDYGPLLQLFAHAVPNADQRKRILWETPQRLFDFGTH